MKAIITIAVTTLLFTTSTIAQLSTRADVKPSNNIEQIELLIVRNAEECLGHESSIYEVIQDKREKVAFLYHESDLRTAASNFYNLNTIRQVLDDYSEEGFEIQSSAGENMEGRCNRQLRYTLQREVTEQ